MFTVRTILHPTDLWESSERAFEVATEMARAHQAKLILLHVYQEPVILTSGAEAVPPIDVNALRDEARQKLKQLTPASVPLVERLFTEGEPVAEILRIAKDTGCDLIVMGTHGRGGLERLLLGSVADHLVRHAPCPVVTVRPTKS